MSWTLRCKWCPYYIVVSDRGAHGRDQGAGVEAAELMEDHIVAIHAKDWDDFRGTKR